MSRATLVAVLCAFALCGCPNKQAQKSDDKATAGAASRTVALPAPVASGLPGDLAPVSHAVNPKNEKAYSGPTATLRGTITVSGDPAPDQPRALGEIKDDCAPARGFYGKVFREGEGRTLADVLVTVTGYQGYVPASDPVVPIEAKNCSWGTRTIALTYGQRVDIKSGDQRSYVPELLGANVKSQLVATPFGKGISSVYPPAPGRFVLLDNLRLFATAEVLVLKYSTHDVTGLDGRYEIAGIPVGKVTVSAFLPQSGSTAQKEVELKAGEAQSLDLALAFDAKKYEQELVQAEKNYPGPSGSGAHRAPPGSSAPIR